MTTYHCSACAVTWWPYQLADGCCPRCGESVGDDAAVFPAVTEAGRRRENLARFEAYYAERQRRRDEATR